MPRDADRLPLPYDPKTTRLLSFHDAVPRFGEGSDTPRAYLERCIERIEAFEPQIKAFAASNIEGARAAADASTARYRAGRPLSPVDGLPIGIKDLLQTVDMPTQMNSPVYEGWESHLDAAAVYALRSSGALIVAKTTTTEFGVAAPPPTRNPFDLERTPGGSSSGSAAAVGACMLPAALGTQLKGSIIRPAAYCANYAIKPSFGALNRGGGHSTSPSGSHLGVHAGTLEDVWGIAYFISQVAGPDPGHAGLCGGADLPAAAKPRRLVRMYCPGWERTDAASQEIFEAFLRDLAGKGIEVVEPADDPRAAAFEADSLLIDDAVNAIAAFEMRWPMRAYRDRGANLLSPKMADWVAGGDAMTIEDYRRALATRERFRGRQAALAGFADGFVSPSSPGPAPKGLDSVGDPIFQTPTSALGAPSITLPLLAAEGMPFGVQLFGFPGGDDRLVGMGRWVRDAFLGG